MKKKSIIPSHSIISNLRFLHKLQFKYAKMSFVFLFLLIPITLALSYLAIYLPKLAVELTLSNTDFTNVIFSVGFVGVIMIILNVLSNAFNTYNFALFSDYNNKVSEMKTKKTLHIDYQVFETEKCRRMKDRADESLWGSGNGSVLERMLKNSTSLITCILGYLLFGTILSFSSPWLIVILTILPIINFFIIKKIQLFQYENKDATTKLDKKLWYISKKSGDFKVAKDIRIYGMNEWLLGLFKKFRKERLHWEKKYIRSYLVSDIIEGLLILLRDGLAYFILVALILNNEIGIGDFVIYFGAVGSFATWVGSIMNNFIELNSLNLFVCDLRDYLNFPDELNKSESAIKPDLNSASEIKFDNVCYRYEGATKDTISNINLEIKAGQKIAIIGLNGAGKTTLIKLLSGLYTPTQGSITINGFEKNDYNIYDYFSMFSVVFQDPKLLPIPIESIIACKDTVESSDNVIKYIELAGLDKKIATLKDGSKTPMNKQLNENATEMSGGETQRLLLARALYKNAPILILDEPTAALDPLAELDFYTKYAELCIDKTSVFISHRLASTKFCDKIILMEDGCIVEQGTHYELVEKNGKYAELYQVQSKYYQEGSEGDVLCENS